MTDCLVSEADIASAARQIPAGEIQLVDESIELTENILAATGGQLFVLAGGRRAPNPAEILAGPFFGQLIAEAANLFDRVVIDSAPILAVSDTLLMTPMSRRCVWSFGPEKHRVRRSAGPFPCWVNQGFARPVWS